MHLIWTIKTIGIGREWRRYEGKWPGRCLELNQGHVTAGLNLIDVNVNVLNLMAYQYGSDYI